MGNRHKQVIYRLRQGVRAIGARPTAETRAIFGAYLTPEQGSLIASLSPRDQYHSGKTASILIAHGVRDRELILAAILHDCGKGRQELWQRVAYVVLAACIPRLFEQISKTPKRWQGALYRSRYHAELGAALAAAGCSERVVELIAGHHQPAAGEDQRLLQWADREA